MTSRLLRSCGFAGAAALCTSAAYAGPDVIVGDLIDIQRYGAVSGITAYAVGTSSCNISTNNATDKLMWISSTFPGHPPANRNLHPVIAQNMYRLKDGRFEQVGMSWLKHGFTALTQNLCNTCQPPGSGSFLGIGCSDPYVASLNGSQGNLGPRSQVNANTGHFPAPFTAPPAPATIGRRLQVLTNDINPTLNPGALYYAEGQYVTQDDARAGNSLNNASYRRIQFASATSTPTFVGATSRQNPAIRAWFANDPTVVLINADYPEANTNFQVHPYPAAPPAPPANIVARYIVGAKVTDNGDGTWDYEYAVQNINSHRSGRGFSIPLACGVTVTEIGFHDVPYHSGEPYSGTDWAATQNSGFGGSITWNTETFAANPNANALRWSTLYNFRFTANAAPTTGTGSIELFRPENAPGEP
ncbi:MAG: hypothetical protein H7Y88_03370, partial [Phycisphaerales bacterium]|nr:hypothetical protein [Phycisphaerales bacterium]